MAEVRSAVKPLPIFADEPEPTEGPLGPQPTKGPEPTKGPPETPEDERELTSWEISELGHFERIRQAIYALGYSPTTPSYIQQVRTYEAKTAGKLIPLTDDDIRTIISDAVGNAMALGEISTDAETVNQAYLYLLYRLFEKPRQPAGLLAGKDAAEKAGVGDVVPLSRLSQNEAAALVWPGPSGSSPVQRALDSGVVVRWPELIRRYPDTPLTIDKSNLGRGRAGQAFLAARDMEQAPIADRDYSAPDMQAWLGQVSFLEARAAEGTYAGRPANWRQVVTNDIQARIKGDEGAILPDISVDKQPPRQPAPADTETLLRLVGDNPSKKKFKEAYRVLLSRRGINPDDVDTLDEDAQKMMDLYGRAFGTAMADITGPADEAGAAAHRAALDQVALFAPIQAYSALGRTADLRRIKENTKAKEDALAGLEKAFDNWKATLSPGFGTAPAILGPKAKAAWDKAQEGLKAFIVEQARFGLERYDPESDDAFPEVNAIFATIFSDPRMQTAFSARDANVSQVMITSMTNDILGSYSTTTGMDRFINNYIANRQLGEPDFYLTEQGKQLLRSQIVQYVEAWDPKSGEIPLTGESLLEQFIRDPAFGQASARFKLRGEAQQFGEFDLRERLEAGALKLSSEDFAETLNRIRESDNAEMVLQDVFQNRQRYEMAEAREQAFRDPQGVVQQYLIDQGVLTPSSSAEFRLHVTNELIVPMAVALQTFLARDPDTADVNDFVEREFLGRQRDHLVDQDVFEGKVRSSAEKQRLAAIPGSTVLPSTVERRDIQPSVFDPFLKPILEDPQQDAFSRFLEKQLPGELDLFARAGVPRPDPEEAASLALFARESGAIEKGLLAGQRKYGGPVDDQGVPWPPEGPPLEPAKGPSVSRQETGRRAWAAAMRPAETAGGYFERRLPILRSEFEASPAGVLAGRERREGAELEATAATARAETEAWQAAADIRQTESTRRRRLRRGGFTLFRKARA